MLAITNAKLVYPDRVQEGTLLMESGRIIAGGDVIAPAEAEIVDAHGMYVGPGLVDIHCHGYSPIHGQKEEYYHAAEQPAEAARAHLRFGTTSITLSPGYSWTMAQFESCIAATKKDMATGESPIVGLHYEGPYINPNYGAASHSAWEFNKETCDKIFDLGAGLVKHCTYAPEMPFAPEFEKYMAERGVIADVGHTEMSPDDLDRAAKNGAKIVTHLFDAMGCWRGNESINITGIIQENAADVALSTPGLYYELICDSRGVHVKPANVRMTLRCAGEDHVILVTDCTPYSTHDCTKYAPDDPMSAPDLNYNTAAELSGSKLTLSVAAANFKRFTGADVRTTFKCAATNAAVALGMDDRIGSIRNGRDANVLIVDEDFRVQAVYFHGRKV